MNTLYELTGKKFTVFSNTCIEVMDFYLSYPTIYFTPTTTALSMEKSLFTVKACMNLLKLNSYLSKVSDSGSTYYITKENMEFWVTDFKNYVLNNTVTLRKIESANLPIQNNEDDE